MTAGLTETPTSELKAWAAQWVPISAVRPYEQNPRHNAGAVAKVAASIREFGWRAPIVVDENGVILAGHTRALAARSLGLEAVPVHVAAGLTPEQARAYRLADNRTAQEATWDWDALKLELGALKDADFALELTGFDSKEIAALLADGSHLLPGADPDEAPPVAAEPTTRPGDRIQLGRHVLVCGDATDTGAWDALLGRNGLNEVGEVVDLVWTDPPYGVSVASRIGTVGVSSAEAHADGNEGIDNDDLDVPALTNLLRESLGLALAASRPGAPWYVLAPHGPMGLAFAAALTDMGVWRNSLVWVKNSLVLGRSDYHYRHEPIYYGWVPGASHPWYSDRSQTTVLEFDRPRRSALHPTMKPVALVEYCLRNSSAPGAVVCDPFGGSGSTLMACEVSGRQARIIELSPAYCDVIVTRWETATGLTAERPA